MVSQMPTIGVNGIDRLLHQIPHACLSTDDQSSTEHCNEADEIAPLIAMFRQMREEKEKEKEMEKEMEKERQRETCGSNSDGVRLEVANGEEEIDINGLEDRLYRYVDEKFLVLKTHLDARLTVIESLIRSLTVDRSNHKE